ncbi:MAG: hypothetical protein N4J56_005782 [Chroococcidiopsis sp. SAG 2025]|uniref:alpha/beta hydrolase n=1 Tax=Chroococcidiopsis sp. SAG 2025 TaxID=171389 RepID=UPI00293717B9|nr:alpha/beta hydrolase [Chroococcidiopsis sp. SAG 2025]MDV2996128.1 hypothetical protein [Chroococcidiopsis sp. SAG 2025]
MKFTRSQIGFLSSLFLAFGWGATIPAATAAETVTFRLGSFEQKIEMKDLERFAKKGKLSGSLQLYAPWLTDDVRDTLNRRLDLDPKKFDRSMKRWQSSASGKQLLAALGLAFPDMTVEQLHAAVSLASREYDGMNIINLLRSYPEENITVDLSQVAGLDLSNLRSPAASDEVDSENRR